jgi:ElaB/YqjD/DUF883 family membrane-anchored ribosome-binding protein
MTNLLPTAALGVVLLEAGWVGPTAAVSLVIIALSFLGMAFGAALAAKGAADGVQKLAREIQELRQDLEPTLRGLGEMAREGRDLAAKMQNEVEALISTSQRIRVDVDRGMKRAKRRLSDFDALAEVVQEEVEETALDVAARVRSIRTGTSVVGRLRRLLWKGRK